MIRAAAGLLARSLLDAAVLLFVIAGLLGYLAWRLVRRFTVGGDTLLEAKSGKLLSVAALAAGLIASGRPVQPTSPPDAPHGT